MDSKPGGDAAFWGVDFSSAPSHRKPIWQAWGRWQGARLQLQGLRPLQRLADFEQLLREPGPWVGGFDLPLGLPRGFADAMGWGPDAAALAAALRATHADRAAWKRAIDAWRSGQPAGERLPHRRCDTRLPGGARSTSPLQTRYVPVALMLYEGLPRLIEAGVGLPGQAVGDAGRVALEAYPGWLAQRVLGRRSYKNTDDDARRRARAELIEALCADGAGLGFRCELSALERGRMLEDASGDPLDAWLCLLQAAWAWRQPNWGLPADLDPVEGWIVGAV